MSTQKNSPRDDRDESLEMQNGIDRQAGIGEGLGDRSSAGANDPTRTGVGGGVSADNLRMPASGASDPTLDENEASYGGDDADGPGRVPTPDRDSSDTPARDDGADRDADEGNADSKGKASFMNMDSEEQ